MNGATLADAPEASGIWAGLAKWQSMLKIRTVFARFRLQLSGVCLAQAFGNVTPCCPWYLPLRSLYEVSQTSSLSKNSTWAQPSPA
jgi:hypothetical protein